MKCLRWGGGDSCIACLSHSANDHASLSRRSNIPTPNRGNWGQRHPKKSTPIRCSLFGLPLVCAPSRAVRTPLGPVQSQSKKSKQETQATQAQGEKGASEEKQAGNATRAGN